MEPSDFNDRLDSLVADAQESGLHENHIENALAAQLERFE